LNLPEPVIGQSKLLTVGAVSESIH